MHITFNEIRKQFVDFFKSKDHVEIESSALLAKNDPTLLFVAAGMVPFKNFFLNPENAPAKRIVTVQKCLRAGGKHNDFDEIGRTNRHHSFFEMLGNFSFGDYFKKEAIAFAWEFLTQTLKIDSAKLHVTVHTDDDEAEALWRKHTNAITKLDCNYWAAGDVGPFGVCSEIFFDLGEHLTGDFEHGERYLEVWNMVFMSKLRLADGTEQTLPKPCIDAGAGLERLSAVLNHVDDTYLIPEMQSIISKICTDNTSKNTTLTEQAQKVAAKIICDHAKSAAFLLSEGVVPAGMGEGYVLRKFIRRAIMMENKLDCKGALLASVKQVIQIMQDPYVELQEAQETILQAIQAEQKRFAEILSIGHQKLEKHLAQQADATIDAEFAFFMHDSLGFPIEILEEIAHERHLQIDKEGFYKLLAVQQSNSRNTANVITGEETVFLGYEVTNAQAKVLQSWEHEGKFFLTLDQTPFYAESGGQISDTGTIITNNKVIQVREVTKQNGIWIHEVSKHVEAETLVKCEVNKSRRVGAKRYHTATHLLHASLKNILGSHVEQKGSLVAANRLRFDFSHFEPLTAQQIKQIETQINEWIQENLPVQTKEESLQNALAAGAVGLFGEKYGDTVRVVSVGEVSMELCGGTHVETLGQIGQLKITKQQSCSAGIRRIEALCGKELVAQLEEENQFLHDICSKLKTTPAHLEARITALQGKSQERTEEIVKGQCEILVIKGDFDKKSIKKTLEQKKNHPVVVLFSQPDGFVVRFADEAVEKYGPASTWMKNASLRGGGDKFLVQGKASEKDVLSKLT